MALPTQCDNLLPKNRLPMNISKTYACIRRIALLLAIVASSGLSQYAFAGEVDFANDIQTVLARRCYSCHGPDTQEGAIRFDLRETLLNEADSGERAIVPGHPEDSELLRRVTSDDEYERMPPEGKPLSEDEVAALRAWIEEGAEFEQHWAFKPIEKPELPLVDENAWLKSPIDAFVLSRLEAKQLPHAGEASPEDLVRRLYIDCTGIPPTPEQIDLLTKDWSEQKYVAIVDRLLADPAFGERWARAWLDVVRYAETNSYERDSAKPNAWKYRDYVIRSFNSDKPYDQFVREQLAGDELESVTPDSLTATGYYRLGIWDDEPADPLQARFDEYDDLVTTTSQGFLGLTLNCARCHDHKIDPLTQKDYYAMVAFMRDVTPYGTRGDQRTFNQRDIDPDVARQHEQADARVKEINRQTRTIEQEAIKKMDGPDQRATEGPQRKKVLKEKLERFVESDVWLEYQSLVAEREEIKERIAQLPPRETVLGLGKVDAQPETTHVLLRGSPHNPGDEVRPVFPNLIGGGQPEIPTPGSDATSAGRRRILADWIASKDNWLTSRVIANRIWGHYFGRAIVASPNNFGLMGTPPTHPLLLDHLATDLMESNWSMKSLHRSILLSSTYRMSSDWVDESGAADPSNQLFWRQNIRRLSAEQVRDGVLAITGQLNRESYGPSMYPTLSAEVLASQSRPGSGWGNSSDAQQSKRSVYIHVKRSLPVPLLTAFDFPETDISCEARFLTTQPAQALTMMNGAWMQQQAEALLKRLEAEVGDDLERQAFRALQLTGATLQADASDVVELMGLVEKLKTKQGIGDREARRAMCLVALNTNAFFYLD